MMKLLPSLVVTRFVYAGLVCLPAALFLFGGPIIFTQTGHARVLERVYAVVNGETITLTEIQDYQKKLKEGGFLNDLLFSDPKERQKASKDKAYLLKLLIDEKIIDFEVKKNGLLVTEERVSKEISTIAQRQNLTINQLRQTLQDQGVKFAEYRDFVKKSIERRQLVEKEITSKIKISEQDIVSDYLSNHSGSQSQIFQFEIAHILLKKNQRSKANQLSQQLRSGKNFAKAAKKHSIDSDSKGKQGKFGTFKSGEMVASMEKAIENLKIGEISEVVSTPMGLHIFKILDKKLIKDPAIEQQKQGIYQKIFAQQFKEQLNFWLSKKRKDAIIQINKS